MDDHQIKCEHCGEWVNPAEDKCVFCGRVLREEEKRSTSDSRRLKDSLRPRFIEIYPTDGIIVKLFKRIGQFGQVIFYAIVTFLVWISSWTVG